MRGLVFVLIMLVVGAFPVAAASFLKTGDVEGVIGITSGKLVFQQDDDNSDDDNSDDDNSEDDDSEDDDSEDD